MAAHVLGDCGRGLDDAAPEALVTVRAVDHRHLPTAVLVSEALSRRCTHSYAHTHTHRHTETRHTDRH
jgi:hypothetical protein